MTSTLRQPLHSFSGLPWFDRVRMNSLSDRKTFLYHPSILYQPTCNSLIIMKCLILLGVLGLCRFGVAEYGSEQPLGIAWRGDQSKAPCNTLSGLCVGDGDIGESMEKGL